MVLDNLQSAIEKLQKTIEAHHGYLAGNETRTRQLLIDPLLRKLGWNVLNPNIVQLEYGLKREYGVKPKYADYALMPKGKPVAVIEAKKLGTDLDDRIMQVLNYANVGGFPYTILTDGDKWEMYKVFEQAKLEDRLLMKLELSQQSAHKNAKQALAMRKPNLASKKPVFKPPKRTMNRSSVKPNKLPKPQPSDDSPKNDNERYPFASEEKFYPCDTEPAWLKIDGRPRKPVKFWKDVIHEVVTWLIDERKLTDQHCPILVGKGVKWTFIDRKGRSNPDGTRFEKSKPLPNDFILQRGHPSLTSQAQWAKLKELLGVFNVDPYKIEVSSGVTKKKYR